MTRTKKTSYPPLNIGTSFMLVIFIILCMVIFAVLSFSSAMKDYNYSQINASRNTSYYEANNQAEVLLSRIDAILKENATVEEQILKLQDLGDISFSSIDESDESSDGQSWDISEWKTLGYAIEYSVPIDESKALQVILTTHPQGEKQYTITTWKQISNAEWTGNQSLPVFGSD